MREYVVQRGDTPASIAAMPNHAGCPKCAIDLVKANPHKEAVVYPNSFATFKNLREGEVLRLPDKWFNGELDARPKSYFAALPHYDGVTPSTLGAAGILGNYAALDAINAAISALPQLDDAQFAESVDRIAVLVNGAVTDAAQRGIPAATDAQASAYWAKQRALEMAAAISAGDHAAASGARDEIQNVLLTAVGSVRQALNEFYAEPTEPTQPTITLLSVAQAAASAIAADPNYCASVAQVGSSVNAAVHAFKSAWNASGQPPVPINTGNYEAETATALASLLGSAPPSCPPRVAAKPPVTQRETIVVPERKGLSTGAVAGIAVLGAATVGTGIYLATRKPQRQRFIGRYS